MGVIYHFLEEIVRMKAIVRAQGGCGDSIDGRRSPLRFEGVFKYVPKGPTERRPNGSKAWDIGTNQSLEESHSSERVMTETGPAEVTSEVDVTPTDVLVAKNQHGIREFSRPSLNVVVSAAHQEHSALRRR
jgi:hypothetical protein